MRVPDLVINRSFQHVGFSREELRGALLTMLPLALKGYNAEATREMRNTWNPENPTRFCCYFVSEMVYWYCAPIGSNAMALSVPGDSTLHRFVRWPDQQIVDLTCDQFDDYSILDYTKAKTRMFLQTGGRGPSARARTLARLLGFKDTDWALTR